MKRLAILTILSTITLPALASYDLMLLPGRSFGNSVLRYDPISQKTLGEVGPKVEPRHVTGHLGGGFAIATTLDNRAFRFNYSTGERIDSFGIGSHDSIDVTGDGKHLLYSGGSKLTSNDLETHAEISYDLGKATTIRTVTSMGSNEFYAIGTDASLNLHFNRYRVGNTKPLATASVSASLVSDALIGQVDYLPKERTVAFVYRQSIGLQLRVMRVVLDSNGDPFGTASATINDGFDFTTAPALLGGHDGFFLAGWEAGLSGSDVRIAEYDGVPNFGFIDATTIKRDTFDRFSAVNLVAPEPGTMLALGAGLAAIVARRRRRSR